MTEARAVTIEHRRLRSAIQFAVDIAAAGQRLRPPLEYPAALKPFLKSTRVPTAELGKLRRAIEADPTFRRRLAAGIVDELVDPIGREWLRREDGWQDRIVTLIAEADAEAEAADAQAALRRAEKRREAAEQATTRIGAEALMLRAQLELTQQQLADARRLTDDAVAQAARLQDEAGRARLAARHALDRAKADQGRVDAVAAERDQARVALAEVEAQRDALLAERAERSGVAVAAGQLGDVRELARSTRAIADRLEAIVTAPTPSVRRAITLPGGVSRDSARATEHLLRAGGVVFVDGYNVAKLAWPADTLQSQRERTLDLADDVARRFGSELVVVFDGADVVGGHTRTRRLARVTYSPAGVTADDVIRAEVAAVTTSRPVVVVTNDQAIRADVTAVGANVVSSDAFLAVLH